MALIFNPGAERTALPEDVVNEGNKPALLKGVSDQVRLAEWLAARIGGIDRLTGTMPSMAVHGCMEEGVEPLARERGAALADRSLSAVACARGQSVGQDKDIRVFDVQHINGLEFEAVFFIDGLADRLPDLFDKDPYVGTARAATFLGRTRQWFGSARGDQVAGGAFPRKLHLVIGVHESWTSGRVRCYPRRRSQSRRDERPDRTIYPRSSRRSCVWSTDAPVRHRHTCSKSKEPQRVTAHEKEPRFTKVHPGEAFVTGLRQKSQPLQRLITPWDVLASSLE
ncbi:hypothetical protein QA645_39300 [Bradyrhizobium sp. CIAT3101]|uniref:hypothetical protein n=1 Tax=Bradyrhizobium sp. CIAT3101 TaxID=439387 RepID=UPI0024B276FD|nr:hypothetical protein [Bradyrhizobium sp. CIAT3101]WFU80467.1 hypothetical protein QA645_39300 [Bradyrhizobium sp. CIAT3101]